MSGYLKGIENPTEDSANGYDLMIPNREIMSFFKETVAQWISEDPEMLPEISKALSKGDTEDFAGMLKSLAIHTLSYHDIEKDQPEHTYPMLVLGMLTQVQHLYHIRSNRSLARGDTTSCLNPRRANPISMA